MRIGILGGTFDPPHLGHLKIVQAAIDSLQLDEVIILPASTNPFKSGRRITEGKHRLDMVKLLCKQNPLLAYSDMELTRGGLSYTVDTLGELQMVHPGEYWFIMGADSLKSFSGWKNPYRILRLCRIAVAVRPPTSEGDLLLTVPEEFHDKIDVVPIEATDISSTNIRDRIAKSQPYSNLTTSEIVDYIKKHKLYK
jgi:nicotinate-nucleotide adenylyltransferase